MSDIAAARSAALALQPLRPASPQTGFASGTLGSIRDIVAHRELLDLLIRRDIKSRYKDSALGFVWSLIRPLVLLLIYYVALGEFLSAARSIPMFAIFDAPSREECTAFRPRTNTALQALVTLNDPTFMEAARVFAQKILIDPTVKTFEDRLTLAFRTAMSRKPNANEMTALRKRYEYLLAKYKADATSAGQIVKVGRYPQPEKVDVAEHATWTGLCNILLNLDETITRE